MATGLENLKIYKMAKDLEMRVFEITKQFPKDEIYRSVDQMKRSSSSITSNIAEGYVKRSLKDRARIFNDIVKGEANETRANLEMCLTKGFHKDQKLIDEYTELIKAISGYVTFLKNSLVLSAPNNFPPSKLIPSKLGSVLAIDPGFDRVGVAIILRKQKEEVLFSDCIVTSTKQSHAERLAKIGLGVRSIILEWKPDSLAIEKLFFNQNTTSAMKVAEARGVILYEANLGGLKIFEYSPQDIKIAVTGYGKASKEQVEAMVDKLVSLKESKKRRLDDEMDAIALGITHLAHTRN